MRPATSTHVATKLGSGTPRESLVPKMSGAARENEAIFLFTGKKWRLNDSNCRIEETKRIFRHCFEIKPICSNRIRCKSAQSCCLAHTRSQSGRDRVGRQFIQRDSVHAITHHFTAKPGRDDW